MRRDADRLADMIEAADAAIAFAAGRERASLETDQLLEAGIVEKIIIIGEAAGRVSEGFRQAHPELPWADIIGMRNVIIHAYWQVDHDVLWRTVTDDLPSLLRTMRPLLDGLEADRSTTGA